MTIKVPSLTLVVKTSSGKNVLGQLLPLKLVNEELDVTIDEDDLLMVSF